MVGPPGKQPARLLHQLCVLRGDVMALQPPQTSHFGAHRDILEGRAPLIPTPGTAAFCCSASLTNTQPPNHVLSPGSPAADGVVLGQLFTARWALHHEQYKGLLLFSAARHVNFAALGNVTGSPVSKCSPSVQHVLEPWCLLLFWDSIWGAARSHPTAQAGFSEG